MKHGAREQRAPRQTAALLAGGLSAAASFQSPRCSSRAGQRTRGASLRSNGGSLSDAELGAVPARASRTCWRHHLGYAIRLGSRPNARYISQGVAKLLQRGVEHGSGRHVHLRAALLHQRIPDGLRAAATSGHGTTEQQVSGPLRTGQGDTANRPAGRGAARAARASAHAPAARPQYHRRCPVAWVRAAAVAAAAPRSSEQGRQRSLHRAARPRAAPRRRGASNARALLRSRARVGRRDDARSDRPARVRRSAPPAAAHRPRPCRRNAPDSLSPSRPVWPA